MEYRNELKFMISDMDMERVRYRLLPFMSWDKHQGEHGYRVRSVYFDDIYDSYMAENEAGTDYRKKYRLRYYNENLNFIRLEKKMKYRGMTQKIVQKLSREESDFLLWGALEKENERVLLKEDCLLKDVYYEMIRKKLVPKCIVEYERFAFVEDKGNVRITFDKNICGSRQADKFYDFQIDSTPIMPYGYHILEIKYSELLPHYILQAIDIGNLRRQSFSKYYTARKVLG